MRNNYDMETVIQISGTNPKKCMACGKCTATCPADMRVPPHKVVKYMAAGLLDVFWNVDSFESLLKCLSCFACIQRCPRGVEPAALIEAIRLMAIRRQGDNYLIADDVLHIIARGEEIPQQLLVTAFRKYSK